MLSVAETPWHVISSAIVLLIGLYFAIAQKRIFNVPTIYSVLLYIWHTFLSLYFFYFSLTDISDATIYYLYSIDVSVPFGIGTSSVYYFTSIFSDLLSMSYFGVFLVFNLLGYIGLVAFAGALLATIKGKSLMVQRTAQLLLFLPGLSFWSAAIGKDSLAFMATGLICWGVHNPKKRYPAVIFSAVVFLMVRPHVAAVLLSSLTIAVIFAMKSRLPTKALLTALFVPVAAAAMIFGAEYVGLGASSYDLAEYVETRQQSNLEGGSSVDIASMNVVARMFTYAFRPLFLDASGVLGLIVSGENLILLGIFILSLIHLTRQPLTLPNFETTFFIVFCIVCWLLFANTTANLGIAVRQKWMFFPMLLMLMMSVIAGSRMRGPVRRFRVNPGPARVRYRNTVPE